VAYDQEGNDQTTAILIRVWHGSRDGGGFIARMTRVQELPDGPTSSIVTVDPAFLRAALQAWITEAVEG
jgi:hypothetical protein